MCTVWGKRGAVGSSLKESLLWSGDVWTIGIVSKGAAWPEALSRGMGAECTRGRGQDER